MTTPEDLTLIDAARLIASRAVTSSPVAEALAYVVDGDVWQGGRAWVGPRPDGTNPGDALISAEIERGLAAANMARELVDRHVAGVIGREPAWTLPDVPEDDAEAITGWWDTRGVHTLLRDALTRALCGEHPVIRLLIPRPPTSRPATLGDALDAIAIERLDSTTATVIDDTAAGLLLACAMLTPDARTLDGLLGRSLLRRVAEIVSAEGDLTMLRLTGDTGNDEEPAMLPLGGRLTMRSLDDVPVLLPPSLLGLQRHLTLTLSAMGRNTQTAGFVERVFANAERPMADDGTPLPYRAGAGMTNWLFGVLQPDGTYATPALHTREPSDPTAFTATAATLIFHGHKEARQLHALIAGDAAPSGESRRQAAADFLASLGPTARSMERLIRWLLETTYALALYLRGQALPADLRASVTMTLSAGVATMEELAETREGVAADLLDRQRYQVAAGVDDPEAEDAAIKKRNGDTPVMPPVAMPAMEEDAP